MNCPLCKKEVKKGYCEDCTYNIKKQWFQKIKKFFKKTKPVSRWQEVKNSFKSLFFMSFYIFIASFIILQTYNPVNLSTYSENIAMENHINAFEKDYYFSLMSKDKNNSIIIEIANKCKTNYTLPITKLSNELLCVETEVYEKFNISSNNNSMDYFLNINDFRKYGGVCDEFTVRWGSVLMAMGYKKIENLMPQFIKFEDGEGHAYLDVSYTDGSEWSYCSLDINRGLYCS